MAIVQNTLIGKTKQSVGGTTFTTWKGRNVLKSKAIAVSNPKTPAQVMQRNRFSACVALWVLMRSALSLSFSRLAGDVTPANKFTSLNVKNFDGSSNDPLVCSFDNLTVSSGDLGVILAPVLANAPGSKISVSFNYEPNPSKALASDMLRAVFLDTVNSVVYHKDVMAVSGDVVIVSDEIKNSPVNVEVYVFSYSTTSKYLSNSFYAGNINTV